MLPLTSLVNVHIDGFWEAFEDLPPSVAAGGLQEKLDYLRGKLEASAGPLL